MSSKQHQTETLPAALRALSAPRPRRTGAAADQPCYGVTVKKDVMITMRDGTRIAADVYRPDAPGAFPTLYAVSPYRKDLVGLPPLPAFRFRETGPITWYVRHGYAYVLADARGTGTSEGRWACLDRAEQLDLYDTIEWIAQQPWSSGRVGMIGESYYGLTQWLAAAQNPPHLACIAPYEALVDLYRDAAYHGGILSSAFITSWHFGVRAAHLLDDREALQAESMAFDLVYEFLRHPLDGPWWEERRPRLEAILVPAYSIGMWNNVGLHLRGNLLGYEHVRGPKKLLVLAGEAQAIFASEAFHERVLLPWYDHWLKGDENGIMDEPPVRLFVRGRDAYRVEGQWPPQRIVPTPYYLHAGPAGAVRSLNDGGLRTTPPTDANASTAISYPDPAWQIGTTALNARGIPNPVARILTFTSAPLRDDLEIAGPIHMVLYAASDQSDTDFYVKVSDQAPVARLQRTVQRRFVGEVPPPATSVTRGWLKASHRELDCARSTAQRPYHTHRNPAPLEPGRIERVEIEVWPAAYCFKKGHRIRIELAPGDSPVADAPYAHYYGLKCGTDTIYHDAAHPSHIVLPVISVG